MKKQANQRPDLSSPSWIHSIVLDYCHSYEPVGISGMVRECKIQTSATVDVIKETIQGMIDNDTLVLWDDTPGAYAINTPDLRMLKYGK